MGIKFNPLEPLSISFSEGDGILLSHVRVTPSRIRSITPEMHAEIAGLVVFINSATLTLVSLHGAGV